MQVVTLNPKDFDAHAARLAEAVMAHCTVPFDAIVGVKRGGSIVCEAFLRHFPARLYKARYDIALQRPSTKHKKGIVAEILKRLPYPLLDAMRKAEACLLSLRRQHNGAQTYPNVEIPEGLAASLSTDAQPEILLIDDAIDSGNTLHAIVDTLRKTNRETKITIAVLTETTDNPRVRADYTLYRNRTLIRFPWSNDYKTPKKNP